MQRHLRHRRLTRRAFNRLGLLTGGSLALLGSGCRGDEDDAPTATGARSAPSTPQPAGTTLTPTPACGDDDELDETPAQTEGPFFKPRSPERTSLLQSDAPGTILQLSGQVLGADCRPVAGALLDFWHADTLGNYDNEGFRMRGHQFAAVDGRWALATILPGLYPGRTRHIHVKVQAPNQRILTTQLYFPNEPDNDRDGLFDAALLVTRQPGDAGMTATFDFVLDI